MLSEEEKFDELVKQKIQEKEFFFDEINWNKMNTLIEQEQRKTHISLRKIFSKANLFRKTQKLL
jgi:hypothetical protein